MNTQRQDRGGYRPRGRLLHDEPLSRHTSWRVGGPADTWFEPADRADLLGFVGQLPESEPLLWVGLGSNLLVRDGGVRGTVIALHGALDTLQAFGANEIHAEAGAHCARLAKFAQGLGKSGLGFLAGIPGTVGGALAMNAGAWGCDTWSQVVAVEAVLRGGRAQWLAPGDFHPGYRTLELPAGLVGFLGARFQVGDDRDGQHALDTRSWLAQRKATQPVGRPTAGSTFRNPPGKFAAQLIEAAGLKGARVGGASVSTLHANFIVTEPGASAADVEALIEQVGAAVLAHSGQRLVPEVRIVGVEK